MLELCNTWIFSVLCLIAEIQAFILGLKTTLNKLNKKKIHQLCCFSVPDDYILVNLMDKWKQRMLVWAFKATYEFVMFHNLIYVYADSLPLGSYCSFEMDSCGWPVSYTQSSWRLVSGQQLTEDTDLLGTTLQNTQGKCETTFILKCGSILTFNTII